MDTTSKIYRRCTVNNEAYIPLKQLHPFILGLLCIYYSLVPTAKCTQTQAHDEQIRDVICSANLQHRIG